MKAELTLAAINAVLEDEQEREHRPHLGASVIGKVCRRRQWYGFRWVKKELFDGRMLRLFDRGQEEEKRFIRWLTKIKARIWDVDPATGKQWRIEKQVGGHFGGSLDGIGVNIPELPGNIPFVCEFKTHNDKSFKLLAANGVANSHPEHYIQAQTYGHLKGFTHALYVGVNKNDDELWPELMRVDPAVCRRTLEKANEVIWAQQAPPRITNDPTKWDCKFCPFRGPCHFGESADVNCRSCAYSEPVANAEWFCKRYSRIIPANFIPQGCGSYLKHPSI